jgi:uncharacterized delta-60 repeat protein
MNKSAKRVRSKRVRSVRVLIEAVEQRVLMSAGQLDPNFGTAGVVTTGVPSGVPIKSSIAVGVDGRVVVSETFGPGTATPTADTTYVSRYTGSGVLDPTFGTGGTVTLSGELVNKILIRPSTPIILVGSKLQQLTGFGTIDTTFDNGGSSFAGTAVSEALQSDGKVVVSVIASSAGSVAGIYRFNSDGTLDTSFGSAGIASTNVSNGGIAVGSAGNIIVAGGNKVEKISPAGTPVTGFGTNGIVAFSTGQPSGAAVTNAQVALDSSGDIYQTANFSGTGNGTAVLMAVNSSGNNTGSATLPGLGVPTGLVVQANGDILIAGDTSTASGSTEPRTIVSRFDPITPGTFALTPDTTFNGTGSLTLGQSAYTSAGAALTSLIAYPTGLALGPNQGVFFGGIAYQAGAVDELFIAKAQPDSSYAAGTGTITGEVFNDLNGDGVRQSDEPLLRGYGAFLDNNNDGVFDAGDVRALTDSTGNYYFYGLTPGTYQVYENPPVGDTNTTFIHWTINVSAGAVSNGVDFGLQVQTLSRFTGTVIGTTGSFMSLGNTSANAFDGNIDTYFDAPDATGDWAGLDLGTAKAVTQILYAPRPGFASRMLGGIFQGSNDPTFDTGAFTLATITSTPLYGTLTPVTFNNTVAYRYYRYYGPGNGYDNIAEMELYG